MKLLGVLGCQAQCSGYMLLHITYHYWCDSPKGWAKVYSNILILPLCLTRRVPNLGITDSVAFYICCRVVSPQLPGKMVRRTSLSFPRKMNLKFKSTRLNFF